MPIAVYVLTLVIWFNNGHEARKVEGYSTNPIVCQAVERQFAELAKLSYVDHIDIRANCVEERAS